MANLIDPCHRGSLGKAALIGGIAGGLVTGVVNGIVAGLSAGAASRVVALDTDAVIKFDQAVEQGAIRSGDKLIVTPNVVSELQNSVGVQDVDAMLASRGITVADSAPGSAVPASGLNAQLNALAGSAPGNIGDALNIAEATGANANVFLSFDKNTIGAAFGTNSQVFLPNSGGASIWITILNMIR